MSSTNRGYDRHQSDYYVTPHKPIKDFLSEFLIDEKINRPDRLMWLDPCAGGKTGGVMFETPMSYPTVIEKEFGAVVSTWDIREDSLAEFKGNYLTNDVAPEQFDIIITNPPFYCAEQIIRKAISDVQPEGYVIMLLRLNFWGSKERKPFFDEFMPKYCYIHHKRISFFKGATDSVEYAHFVWQKGHNNQFTKTKLI